MSSILVQTLNSLQLLPWIWYYHLEVSKVFIQSLMILYSDFRSFMQGSHVLVGYSLDKDCKVQQLCFRAHKETVHGGDGESAMARHRDDFASS